MRTCVCGYGLVRHPSSLPTLVERVVAPAECGAADVYCHTWSDVTAPRDLAALAAALPGARIVATPQAEYDAAQQDDYGWLDAANVYDHYKDGHRSTRNQLRASASLALAFAEALQASPPYDAYVFARLDCYFLQALALPTLVGSDECYVPDWGAHGGVNDRFAVCGAAAAAVYAARGLAYEARVRAGKRGNTEGLLRMYLRKERRLQCPPLPRDFVFLRVRADGTVPRKDAKRIDASLRKRVDGAPTVAVPDVPFADDDPVPGAFPDRPPCGGPLGTAGAARRRLVLFGKAYSSDVTGDGPRAAPRTFAAFSPSRLSPRALTLAFWGFLLVVAAVAHTKLYYGTQLATWLEMYPPQPRVCDAHAAREPSLPPLAAPLRAAVLVLYDDAATESRLSGFGALAERSIANKRAYCEAHGYTLIVAGADVIDRSRPPAWSKILALQAHLGSYDYVLFVDVDVLVMNGAVRIEDLVGPPRPPPAPPAGVAEAFAAAAAAASPAVPADLVISEDWNGLNTGVFVLRNSPWSHALLAEMWAQEQLVAPVQHAIPFEYEQRALHYLMNTAMWSTRSVRKRWVENGLPPWRPPAGSALGGSSAALWTHLRVLPQCALNAYLLYPLSKGTVFGQRDSSKYAPGDFAAHLAGHKASNKVVLFEYLLRHSTVGAHAPPPGAAGDASQRGQALRGGDGE